MEKRLIIAKRLLKSTGVLFISIDDNEIAGLKEEVEKLLAEGVSADCQSMKSIGYRQMLWYLQDGMVWDEMVEKLKQATRNFAKRQFTWYRHMDYIDWYELDRKLDYEYLLKDIVKKLAIAYKMN